MKLNTELKDFLAAHETMARANYYNRQGGSGKSTAHEERQKFYRTPEGKEVIERHRQTNQGKMPDDYDPNFIEGVVNLYERVVNPGQFNKTGVAIPQGQPNAPQIAPPQQPRITPNAQGGVVRGYDTGGSVEPPPGTEGGLPPTGQSNPGAFGNVIDTLNTEYGVGPPRPTSVPPPAPGPAQPPGVVGTLPDPNRARQYDPSKDMGVIATGPQGEARQMDMPTLEAALRAGAKFANDAFNLKQQGVLPGQPHPEAQAGAQALQQHVGRNDPADNAELDRLMKNDPQFGSSVNNIRRLEAMYRWKMSQGDTEGANRAAFEAIQSANYSAARWGMKGIAALYGGNTQQAIDAVVHGLNEVPDGYTYSYDPQRARVFRTDSKTGKPAEPANGIPVHGAQLFRAAVGLTSNLSWQMLNARVQATMTDKSGTRRTPAQEELTRSAIDLNRARIDKLKGAGAGRAGPSPRASSILGKIRGADAPAADAPGGELKGAEIEDDAMTGRAEEDDADVDGNADGGTVGFQHGGNVGLTATPQFEPPPPPPPGGGPEPPPGTMDGLQRPAVPFNQPVAPPSQTAAPGLSAEPPAVLTGGLTGSAQQFPRQPPAPTNEQLTPSGAARDTMLFTTGLNHPQFDPYSVPNRTVTVDGRQHEDLPTRIDPKPFPEVDPIDDATRAERAELLHALQHEVPLLDKSERTAVERAVKSRLSRIDADERNYRSRERQWYSTEQRVNDAELVKKRADAAARIKDVFHDNMSPKEVAGLRADINQVMLDYDKDLAANEDPGTGDNKRLTKKDLPFAITREEKGKLQRWTLGILETNGRSNDVTGAFDILERITKAGDHPREVNFYNRGKDARGNVLIQMADTGQYVHLRPTLASELFKVHAKRTADRMERIRLEAEQIRNPPASTVSKGKLLDAADKVGKAVLDFRRPTPGENERALDAIGGIFKPRNIEDTVRDYNKGSAR